MLWCDLRATTPTSSDHSVNGVSVPGCSAIWQHTSKLFHKILGKHITSVFRFYTVALVSRSFFLYSSFRKLGPLPWVFQLRWRFKDIARFYVSINKEVSWTSAARLPATRNPKYIFIVAHGHFQLLHSRYPDKLLCHWAEQVAASLLDAPGPLT